MGLRHFNHFLNNLKHLFASERLVFSKAIGENATNRGDVEKFRRLCEFRRLNASFRDLKYTKTHVVLIGLGWGCLATQVQANNILLDTFLPLPSPVKVFQGFPVLKTNTNRKPQSIFKDDQIDL